MKQAPLLIVNRLGLHARAATKFVNLAKTFESTVRVRKGDKAVDGKSIMSVLLLEAPIGTELVLECDGADASEAHDALSALVADRFGEDE